MTNTATHSTVLDELSHYATDFSPLPGGRAAITLPGVAEADSVRVTFDHGDEEETMIHGRDARGWVLYEIGLAASTPADVLLATIEACAGIDR